MRKKGNKGEQVGGEQKDRKGEKQERKRLTKAAVRRRSKKRGRMERRGK